MIKDDELKKFKELLESQHDWPSKYHFKFIVPFDKLSEIEALFPKEELIKRASQKGNYVSVNLDIQLESADHVIAIYQKASNIKGLISL